MIIQHANFGRGEVKVKIQSREDLWYLSQVIETGDFVEGLTLRKVKTGSGDENSDTQRKKVFLRLQVEKIEFHKYTQDLRVSGLVAESVEDVPKGTYHTFNLEEGSVLSIFKKRFLKHQQDRLKEAVENKSTRCLICALERDNATFALLRRYGFEVLGSLQGSVEKKFASETIQKNFYEEVAKQLQDYVQRNAIETIIIGSPAFWKEQLQKVLSNYKLPRVILASSFSSGEAAIEEILRRPEIKEALKHEKTIDEISLVEELFAEIAKEGMAVYGSKEVKIAAEQGAVKVLLITQGYMQKMRLSSEWKAVELILDSVDDAKGEICIVSSDHEGGARLDGLGGIGALLRYKLSY